MSGYDIFLSDGDLLTSVNVKTVDVQQNSSLYLIGQGIPDYGTMVAQDFVWLMEHFSKSSPPVHPLVGQQWHDRTKDRMNFYTTSGEWHPYLTGFNSSAAKFDMLPAATDIDFSVVQTVAIFTAPDTSKKYCPNSLVLIPNGTPVATGSPVINLSASSAGDVLASTTITIGAVDQYIRLPAVTEPRMATSSFPTISLNITTAATGGALHYDAYLFGFTV